jgi:hypothetical protein
MKVGKIRHSLSRWYAGGQVPKPTAAEISAAEHHDAIEGVDETRALEGSDTGDGR